MFRGLHQLSSRFLFHTKRDARNPSWARFFSTGNSSHDEREEMPFDVLIVGGGPAGLSAAIRLKQLCLEKNMNLSVCIVEKGSEIGSHILSGNVFDPRALNELLPQTDWVSELRSAHSSFATPVSQDQFLVLSNSNSYQVPSAILPPELHNEGNFIISLSQLCRWLASKAEDLGVEIYPGFAASNVLFNEDQSAVRGIVTRDNGIGKVIIARLFFSSSSRFYPFFYFLPNLYVFSNQDTKRKDTFQRGVALVARQTLFAEGARGSCSESLISHFNLRKDKLTQTYGLGIKEVWEIPRESHKPGLVIHTLGYPLQSSFMDPTFGGAFLYHQEPNLVLAGMVIGLDYSNPYLHPYKEFQQWKTHPDIRQHFANGSCISYGARVLNEGGVHSIPKLTFPGGCLIGCSAGFLNAVKIKGTHNAMKSGSIAAECIFELLQKSDVTPVGDTGQIDCEEKIEATLYEDKIKKSWVYDELYPVRNCHGAFQRWGVLGGLMYSGFATHITRGREPWTLIHNVKDSDATKEAKLYSPKTYPSPDGVLTFDLLTNLQRSGTYHEEDQEAHLRIKPNLRHFPEEISLEKYAAPEQRFCPAGVYEYVDEVHPESGQGMKKKLVINAQNCIHCKCCSIKAPGEYIEWTVPEGGGGPNYQVM